MLAALTNHEESLVWVILAVLAFGVAIYLASVRNIIGAVVAGVIGLVVLLVAL